MVVTAGAIRRLASHAGPIVIEPWLEDDVVVRDA
jgi:hypothetical protein